MTPVHLLIYSVQTAVTTVTCIAEYLSWTHLSTADKVNLGYLYVPYLALCKFSPDPAFFSLAFFFPFLREGVQ